MGKELYGITVDHFNRIWIGSRSGVTVIDYNNTLFDKSDDDLSGTLTTTDGIVDNDVRSMAEDYDGTMWLGTPQGINYWQGGEVFDKGGVVHNNIQTIVVDVRNNKWFGTIGGVSVLGSDNYTWTEYTTDNSPLVSSSVTSVALDELTGKVYIGTTNGLSSLQTPYVKPQPNLDQVTAGPNPFILRNSVDFTIYKLTDNSSIKFLTTNGMLVRDVPKDYVQGFYEWDGRDDNGEFVASGVYLYLIYNEETGASHVGKVAVIK
jgi:ligand-binding sensor domain-containing protein